MIRYFAALALAALSYCNPAFAIEATQCADCLPYGMPTIAPARPVTILTRKAYVVAHDDQRLTYDWVAWPLTAAHAIGCDARKNQFHTDPDLPKGRRAVPKDYLKTGFDLGHGFDDMDATWDATVQNQSFLTSNMAPQAPGLNRQGWEQMEAVSRAWAFAGLGPLEIYDVPQWSAAPKTIGDDHVAVPDAFAKVVYSPIKRQAVAVLMPNSDVDKSKEDLYITAPWETIVAKYSVSIAEVEQKTGVTIPLPADTDKTHAVVPWPADLAGYAKAKKAACAVAVASHE